MRAFDEIGAREARVGNWGHADLPSLDAQEVHQPGCFGIGDWKAQA